MAYVVQLIRTRSAVVSIVSVAYVLTYYPLHSVLGDSVAILSTVPVLTAAWSFGTRGGVVAGLTAFPVNSLFAIVVTEEGWTDWIARGGAVGSSGVVAVGLVTGMLRDLQSKAVREIEGRKHAEESLRESEERYRNLVENSSDILWETDELGVYTYCSPNMTTVTGYELDAILGRKPFDFMPAPEARPLASLFQRFADDKEPFSFLKHRVVCKDGHVEFIECSGKPIIGQDGQLRGYRGIDRVITERVTAEDERRALELKALVQSNLAALGQVASGVAHEISQPLTYISTINQGLQEGLALRDVDEETVRQRLEESLRQVERISRIVRHLQTFGRSDETDVELLNLRDVLDNTLLLLGESLRLKNITVERQIEDGLSPILGNSNQLEQVLINLFQNSVDAFRDNQRDGKITVGFTSSRDGTAVEITFSDNGVGIEPEHLPSIYDPFFTTKPVGQGTGLGLAIVRGVVRDHRGTIDCRSEHTKGTTFTITLPVGRE